MNPVATAVVLITLLAACDAATPQAATVSGVPDAVSPTAGVIASGRLAADDVERLRAAGIRQVIDLSLDSETPGFDEGAAMQAAGIAYSNLPVRGPADLTPENVRAFDALLAGAARPVLVHCASGNRVGAMAALRAGWVEGRSVEEALDTGRAWGLKGLEGEVRTWLQEQGPR